MPVGAPGDDVDEPTERARHVIDVAVAHRPSLRTAGKIDDAGEITNVSSPGRTIPSRLRRWVEEAFPTCGRTGCDSRFALEIAHQSSTAVITRTNGAAQFSTARSRSIPR